MSLLGSLFSRRPAPRRQPSVTTDDAFNAVFVPLRNRVCDFKDATRMSWTLILPAIQRISIRLLMQAHGREATQNLLESMMRKMEEEHGSYPNVVRNIALYPDLSPDQLPQLAKLTKLLWQIADEMITTACPVERVAEGFSRFVALVASRTIDLFGEFYAAGLIHASYRELQSGAFDDDRAVTSSIGAARPS
jgi:hypothetical protein